MCTRVKCLDVDLEILCTSVRIFMKRHLASATHGKLCTWFSPLPVLFRVFLSLDVPVGNERDDVKKRRMPRSVLHDDAPRSKIGKQKSVLTVKSPPLPRGIKRNNTL